MPPITIHLHKPHKRTTVTYRGELARAAPGYALVEARWERARLDLGYTTFEPGDRFAEHFYADRWYAIFEVEENYNEPETTIALMLDAVEALESDARTLWAECSLRELNIGYDCGDEPWAFNNGLTNATLLRAVSAGMSLRITLYPPTRPRSPARSRKGKGRGRGR